MTGRLGLSLALVIMGAGWGLTQPLTKIAVSSGYGHFGLIFWQMTLGAVLTGGVLAARGSLPRMTLARLPIVLVVAALGTLLPNTTSYQAAFHLPSGVMSIIIATVPMFAFPVALMLGIDRFSMRRLAGLAIGLAGVALIALPRGSLPDPAMLAWIPVALVAPLCYALEGNAVNKMGTAGLSAVGLLCLASILGALVALPLALASGHWIVPAGLLTREGQALMASGVVHVAVYSGYIWLVGRAGAVFAGQVAYLVTGFGVLWAMVLLDESYSGWVWAALAAMLVGLTLVRPRRVEKPVDALPPGTDTGPAPGAGQT